MLYTKSLFQPVMVISNHCLSFLIQPQNELMNCKLNWLDNDDDYVVVRYCWI